MDVGRRRLERAGGGDPRRGRLLDLLRLLANNPLERVSITACAPGDLLARREQLHEFVEGLYDFWRRWDRFLVVRAEVAPAPGDKRPLRGFTETVEALARLVRATYRDVAENITGRRPRVLRQVAGRRRGGRVRRAPQVAGAGAVPPTSSPASRSSATCCCTRR